MVYNILGKDSSKSKMTNMAIDVRTMMHVDDVEAKTSPQAPKNENYLVRIQSHVAGHNEPTSDIYTEAGDERYDKFTKRRKRVIVAILSLCGFLSPISSTTVLSAIPEVAGSYRTTSSIINVSNALYLAFMGICPLLFGPISSVYGRRMVSRSHI